MQQASRDRFKTSKKHVRSGWCAALGVTLLIGCAGSERKQVPPQGEGGEAGAAEAAAGDSHASPDSGTGGVGGAQGPAPRDEGEEAMGGATAAGGAADVADEPGGAESGTDVGGAEAGAGPSGAAGASGEPPIPTSVCGPGKWFAGEGLCGDCPQTSPVVELDCDSYASAQVLTSTTGQLQFAFASLPAGVQAHEASPVDVSVSYVAPDESHLRVLRLNTTGWTVDLREAPDPPQSIIVPPFSTADVCGGVFRSIEAVRFDRAAGQATTYVKVCP